MSLYTSSGNSLTRSIASAADVDGAVTLPTAVVSSISGIGFTISMRQDIAAHEQFLQTGSALPAIQGHEDHAGWMFPYFTSRILPGEFQPNHCLPLHRNGNAILTATTCWSYDNAIKGRPKTRRRRAIDWLESTPCRVLAPTGGEPLIRPDFCSK